MDKFIVSARKYRPATFESVVGQKHITSTLRNAISRNQLAHAYLFCGPRGVGKTTCARIFAKAINCLSTDNGSEACGECESCRAFNENRSFNIHELDAASNNSVDDIRSLTEQVRIPPQIGRYSVYIIDEVHMLSAQAFNAFLKTLEEPPAHAVFVLATTEKHKIIPTILSRCQIYDFNRIRVEDGVEYLKYIAGQEGISYDDESLHLIAQKADGGMRDALSMFDKAVSFCGNTLEFKEVAQTLNILDYDTYFNITSLILAGDYPSVLTSFDEVLRKGFSGQTFIGGLNAHFRDILMCKNPQTEGLLEMTGTLLDKYKKQSEVCDTGFLFEAISLLTSLDGTLRTATNQRLNIELGLMKLCGLAQKKNSRQDVKQTDETSSNDELEDNPSSAITATLDEKASLPPLVGKSANANQQKVIEAAAAQKTTTPTAVSEISQPETSKVDSIPDKKEEAHEKTPENVVTPSVKEASVPPIDPRPLNGAVSSSPTISGPSIADLLDKPKGVYDEVSEGETAEEKVEITVDSDSEKKIASVRDEFIARLNEERPRIAMAFHNMNVKANCIYVTVPSESLREEILRNRTEILTLLTDIGSINGFVDLLVEVKEDDTQIRPIRVEDKLKFLMDKNPDLALLRQKLDMDIE